MRTTLNYTLSGAMVLAVMLASALPDAAAGLKPVAYDVREFGGVGDGVTLNTAAIQRAIDTERAHFSGPVHELV